MTAGIAALYYIALYYTDLYSIIPSYTILILHRPIIGTVS